MKKNVKLILLGIIILLIIIGAVYSALKPLQTDVIKIEPKLAELSFSEQGTLTSDRSVSIFPLIPGQIKEVNVKLGDTLKAGEIICVIDSSALEYQISQIRSTIRSVEAEKASANILNKEKIKLQKVLVSQTEKDLENAKNDLEKARILYEEGAISKQEYEDIEKIVNQAEVALISQKQELTILESGNTEYYNALIQSNEISIAKLRKDIENCNVVTPVSGVVTEITAKNINNANGSVPVAVVTSNNEKVIEVYISTKDVNSISVNDEVEITLKNREGDINFSGKISHIDTVATSRPSALGVIESRVRVEIMPTLDDKNVTFGIGYNVDVKFYLYKEENKILVPKTALFKEDDKDMLFVVKGGKARKVEVVKGMELRTEIVVEDGLKKGDIVIIEANDKKIKNGAKIK